VRDLREGVHLGLLVADLSLPECFSLKEKRSVVRGVIDALRHAREVSVAEVGCHDAHTRARIAVACVGADRAHVERLLDRALRTIESREGLVLNDAERSWC